MSVVFGEMMALNNPKPVQSWCVILQTFSKKNRKELVGALVQGFGLDDQEASDAIANLPIVVVDQLNLNEAKTVKSKLEVFGAVIEITNHDIIKKKCYRIEWPAQPSLAYFQAEPPKAIPNKIIPVATSVQSSATPPNLEIKSSSPDATATAPLKTSPTQKPSFPLSTAVPSPAKPTLVEKDDDVTPKVKKSWFAFGQKKQSLLPATKLVEKTLSKPVGKSIPSAPQPSAIKLPPHVPGVDSNQSEWQKRTQQIQRRLEKIDASVPLLAEKFNSNSIKKTEGFPLAKGVSGEKLKSAELPLIPEKKDTRKILDTVVPPVISAKSSDVLDQPGSLVNQSHDLLGKIENLEKELTQKKQSLEQKQVEIERRNKEVELKHRQFEEVEKIGADFSEKASRLEKILSEKENDLRKKNTELEIRGHEVEQKHRQLEDAQKKASEFSEKVIQLEKALSEKDNRLNAVHSELEQKIERERSLAASVSQLESQLAGKSAELETQKLDVLRLSAETEERLKAKDKELVLMQERNEEVTQKLQVLEKSMIEKIEAMAAQDSELHSKDQKIQSLNIIIGGFEKKIHDLQISENEKRQQVVSAQSRENEAHQKLDNLDKTMIKMSESIAQRDESLRERDEVLALLEKRVHDLAEKTGEFETLKATHFKLQEEFEDIAGKHNRLSEEHRRLRSKNERKVAAMAREMGEWVRKVDSLRQGLQKFNQNIVRPEFSDDADSDSEAPPLA